MKLKTLVLATSIALSAMAVASTTQAGALATSVLDLTDLTFSRGGTILNVNDFTQLAITNSADRSAALDGEAPISDGVSGSGEDINFPVACVGPGCNPIVEDTFPVITNLTNPIGPNFAAADQLQAGSPIAGLEIGDDPIPSPAQAAHSAYVALHNPGDGSAAANNGLSAGFEFALVEEGGIDFSFDARAYLEAFTYANAEFPTSASAEYGLVFSITDLGGAHGGGTIMNWRPDGVSNIGSTNALGLTAETDPFSLNAALSRNAPFNGVSFLGAAEGTAFSGSWSGTTIPLFAGNDYQLTIRSTALADANKQQQVSEPITLALMGLGILGLGLIRRLA